MARIRTVYGTAIFITVVTFASAVHAAGGIETQKELAGVSSLVANPPLEYMSCLNSSECRVVHSSCGASRAINQSHVDQYESSVAAIASNIDCPDPKITPTYIAECKNNICTLQAQ